MRTIVGCVFLLSLLASAACRTMKSVSLEQLNTLKPDRAWVTSADQSVVLVLYPHVVGDTLVGCVDGKEGQLPTTGLNTAGLGGLVVALSGNDDAPHANILPIDCNKRPTDPGCSI